MHTTLVQAATLTSNTAPWSTYCSFAPFASATLQVRREMMAQATGVVIPRILSFDGNIITPGTPFMANLAQHLRQYLQQKAAADPAWQHLQVQ